MLIPEPKIGFQSHIPEVADVVIVGAGIVGCSIAYHLAHKGVNNIVILEQDSWPGPGGSTNHASDFIYPIDHSKAMTKLTLYGIDHYKKFGRFKTSGGLEVARTQQRLEELKRKVSSGTAWGVEAYITGPSETVDLFPFLDGARILGAKYTPSAGLVDRSVDVAQEMVNEAVQMGAVHLIANTPVTAINTGRRGVRSVETSKGSIRTELVVSAAGVWGPLIGEMAGAPVPLIPAHHPLMFTASIPELKGTKNRIEFPLLRDQDASAYVRQDWDSFEFGYYETDKLRVLAPEDIQHADSVRVGLSPTMIPLQIEHVLGPMEQVSELIPCLATAQWKMESSYNGVLSFTSDGAPILGESPEVPGFWMAEAVWVKDGPGVGNVMAEWIVDGHPKIAPQEFDVARFYPHAKTRSFVLSRSTETAHKVYGIIHPREQYSSQRDLKLTAFNQRERELGAKFFEAGGWERPQWFESNKPLLDSYRQRIPVRESEWDARWWSPIINAEHLAMRERVAMIDLSAFSKFDVTGHCALEYMQRMTVAQMDVPVSRLVYTPILNQMGGVVADLTVARIGHNHFRVIAGGASGNMDKTWFQSHLPQDGSVKFADVTEEYSVLGVWGPSARELLQSISDDDVTNAAFPFSTVKQITVGDASVWAVRISYVGELGWELYIPVGQSLGVWDLIWAKRKAFGLVPAGLGVYLSTARLEKGYRLQGSDLETEYDSYESGVARPKVKPQDFVGREAYLATRKIEPAATLCTMTVDCNQSSIGINRYMSGGEPLLTMDGRPIVDAKGRRSYVTSAADGPSIGKYMLMGYLPPLYAVPETNLQVEYFAEHYPVTVKAVGNSPLYDPKNAKLRK